MKKRRLFPFLILTLLFAWPVYASNFEITEIQTRGDGGAYDECVKIKNNGQAPISLLNYKLQSRSATQDRWISRSGEGLPNININPLEIIILASNNYSGSDETWRHTARWGFADDGGGIRLLNVDDIIVAEKYWGGLETENATPPQESSQRPESEEIAIVSENFSNDAEEMNQTESIETETMTNYDGIEDGPQSGIAEPAPEANSTDYTNFQITISEFMPDPTGSDEGEWIEIKNFGENSINIGDWKIDDKEGGSKPFQIPKNTIIAPDGFVVFYKSQTKIALNNDEDSVRLINPLNEIFQEISYSNSQTGVAYAVDNALPSEDLADDWSWTTTPTPAGDNLISQPKQEISEKSSSISYDTLNSKTIELSAARDLPKDTKITTSGIVIAPPEVLGSQIFYIDGMQIYMYTKNFPDLTLGDEVKISGILSEIAGETRIKTKNSSDIVVVLHGDKPLPHEVKIEDIGEDLEGFLVKVSGEVIEINNNGFYLSDEEGNEIKVYFKEYADLSSELVKPGDNIEVVGIVSQTTTGYRLLPRYDDDIIIKEDGLKNDENKTSGLSSKYKYFAILGGGFLAALMIRGWRRKDDILKKVKKQN